MASSSFNIKDLSPKSRMMMKYTKKLEDKIEKLGGGLESMRINSHGVNSKIRTLSKMKIKEVMKSKKSSNGDNHDESYGSHNSKSSRSHKSERVVKQNLDCLDCEDLIKVKLIALSFEGYALIW
ncbi:hypothetical protein CR513_36914, partial [Mucuna pruriens]